jgi:hypothetical protein
MLAALMIMGYLALSAIVVWFLYRSRNLRR